MIDKYRAMQEFETATKKLILALESDIIEIKIDCSKKNNNVNIFVDKKEKRSTKLF
jgi:hypothetical protein